MPRNLKKMFIAGALGVAFCLVGCGKGQKIDSETDFSVDDISEIVIDNSSWNLKILTSSDEKIHVSYNGIIKDGDSDIQVLQNDNKLIIEHDMASTENIAYQFSFGKDGTISLYIPQNVAIPMSITNGSGEIEFETVSLSEIALENDSGYVTVSELTTETMKMYSVSGDIKIENSSCSDLNIQTKSAYVTIKNTPVDMNTISTNSGEVIMSGLNEYTTLSVKTESGDISLSHRTMPHNLSYDISSGSDDITMQLKNTEELTDTAGCKQGSIGKGECSLSIMSDNGTISVK